MFNNNRRNLVLFAAVVCMQMVHGMHYRKNKKLLPHGAEVIQIKAAQAKMRPKKPLAPMEITIPFDAPNHLNNEMDADRSKMAVNMVGFCIFSTIAACTLLTAPSSL